MMNFVQYCFLIPLLLNLPAVPHDSDIDSDGLDDQFEQLVLERFVPTWMLSAKECDGLPAEFQPDNQAPQLMAKNGTIYGQVFPTDLSGGSGVYIEAHYYHLWNRDCGLNGHALDVEHVSVLLSAEALEDSISEWKSEYWYAAAHEDTACDASHAAKSSSLNAERRGPTVWISAGKHASYLEKSLCDGGCGCDDCSEMIPVETSKIINLGEPGAPMNGASWAQWSGWPLGAKMETDFPETVLAKLYAAERPEVIPVNDSRSPVKKTILVGTSSAGAMIGTNSKTSAALSSASGAVGKSLDKSKDSTGNFLSRAARSVWRLVGGGNDANSKKGGQQ
jgi:hypothetical protein